MRSHIYTLWITIGWKQLKRESFFLYLFIYPLKRRQRIVRGAFVHGYKEPKEEAQKRRRETWSERNRWEVEKHCRGGALRETEDEKSRSLRIEDTNVHYLTRLSISSSKQSPFLRHCEMTKDARLGTQTAKVSGSLNFPLDSRGISRGRDRRSYVTFAK